MRNFNIRLLGLVLLQIACIAGVVLLLRTQMAGQRISDADFETVSAKISEAAEQSADRKLMQPGDNQMIRRLYGLDPEAYDGMLLYYPATNMAAQELLLVRLTDLSQQETVVEAMEQRAQSQRSSFEGYAPEQYSLVENHVLDVQGNYLLYVTGTEAESIKAVFEESLR